MIKIIGRNRLEKLFDILIIISATNFLTVGFCVWLITLLNKYNYMEYIRKTENSYKVPIYGIINLNIKGCKFYE